MFDYVCPCCRSKLDLELDLELDLKLDLMCNHILDWTYLTISSCCGLNFSSCGLSLNSFFELLKWNTGFGALNLAMKKGQ